MSYLEHHGILGMKWGVRRYQNKDGSLTAAGKEKYGTKARNIMQKQYSDPKLASTFIADPKTGNHIGVNTKILNRRGLERALKEAYELYQDKSKRDKIRKIEAKYFDAGYKYLFKKTKNRDASLSQAIEEWMETTGLGKKDTIEFVNSFSKYGKKIVNKQ